MFRLLIIMPLILAIVVYLLNPTYFNPLFTTNLGGCILFLILLLFIVYVLVVKKILKVDL